MKTINLRAQSAPIGSINLAAKFKSILSFCLLKLNALLPDDCQVKSKTDVCYIGAIAFVSATLVFWPFVIGAVFCVIKAKKGGVKEYE